jgi:hypothetical protein
MSDEAIYNALIEYRDWLKDKNISLKALKNAPDNEKHILTTAYIREKRKGWNITKREKEIIKKYQKIEIPNSEALLKSYLEKKFKIINLNSNLRVSETGFITPKHSWSDDIFRIELKCPFCRNTFTTTIRSHTIIRSEGPKIDISSLECPKCAYPTSFKKKLKEVSN